MGIARGTARSLYVVPLLLTAWALPAQTAAQRVRNVTPAQGEWMDGAACRGLHGIVASDGYDVGIAKEQLTSREENVDDDERASSDLGQVGASPAPSWGGSPTREGRRPPREPCDQAVAGQQTAGRVPDQVLGMVLAALAQRLPAGELPGGGRLRAMLGLLARPQLFRTPFAPHP
jgi:hypothetical protein